MTEANRTVTFRIGGAEYVLAQDDVVGVAHKESPRKVNAYFVEIEGRQYPPKQLIRTATGTSAFFDTALAVKVLRDLGFTVNGTDTNS